MESKESIDVSKMSEQMQLALNDDNLMENIFNIKCKDEGKLNELANFTFSNKRESINEIM